VEEEVEERSSPRRERPRRDRRDRRRRSASKSYDSMRSLSNARLNSALYSAISSSVNVSALAMTGTIVTSLCIRLRK